MDQKAEDHGERALTLTLNSKHEADPYVCSDLKTEREHQWLDWKGQTETDSHGNHSYWFSF